MEIIVNSYFPYEPYIAVHAMMRKSSQDCITATGYRVCAWVEVTHETKDKVMARVTEDDKKAVGCKNPDIYVVSRRDDRIVLTRPRGYPGGKGRKHITSIRAGEIFGPTWSSKINICKLERLGQFCQEAAHQPHLAPALRDKNAVVFLVYIRSVGWVAYLYSRHVS